MLRFLLFGGPKYYGTGGFYDYVDSFDSADQAIQRAKELEKEQEDEFEWWHIFDMLEHSVVGKSECKPHGAWSDSSHINGLTS